MHNITQAYNFNIIQIQIRLNAATLKEPPAKGNKHFC